MKVLDLQCAHQHTFEGWFACESDFVAQCEKSMVQCPICGNSAVVKKLSAPRLNLARIHSESSQSEHATANADQAFTAAWLEVARQLIANTTDVGGQFAEEARKIHYRESDERGIRGTTTPDEARALRDEGIDVITFVLPEALKEPLQ